MLCLIALGNDFMSLGKLRGGELKLNEQSRNVAPLASTHVSSQFWPFKG